MTFFNTAVALGIAKGTVVAGPLRGAGDSCRGRAWEQGHSGACVVGPAAASLRLLVQIAKGKAEGVFRGSLAQRGSEGDVGEELDEGDD